MKKIILAVCTLAALVATASPALAQAEGQVRESIPAAPFLAAAYAFMWLAVLVYVGLVARRLTRVQGDIEDLRRKLDQNR
jgi:hypothetical protein